MDPFLPWLLHRADLEAAQYRAKPLGRRLPACLRALRVKTTTEAQSVIESQPKLLCVAMDAVLLGVTEFFRDREVFRAIEEKVMPDVATSPKPLRIWSAACSTGQELYSLAFLVAQVGRLEGSDLLGTDCRAEALTRAAAGVFREVEVAEALDRRTQPYFHADEEGGVRVGPELRAAVRWRMADLFREREPGPWDIISWRNMAIYLEAEAAQHLWERLWHELRPGGYIITGKAEYPPRSLGWSRVASCLYRKVPTS